MSFVDSDTARRNDFEPFFDGYSTTVGDPLGGMEVGIETIEDADATNDGYVSGYCGCFDGDVPEPYAAGVRHALFRYQALSPRTGIGVEDWIGRMRMMEMVTILRCECRLEDPHLMTGDSRRMRHSTLVVLANLLIFGLMPETGIRAPDLRREILEALGEADPDRDYSSGFRRDEVYAILIALFERLEGVDG